jgi:lantibiotic modifying enzyme
MENFEKARADFFELLASIAKFLNNPNHNSRLGFGVNLGKGGKVLFNCHYAAYTGDEQYYSAALADFEKILTELNPENYKSNFGTNYYQELAELGNLVCHLEANNHLDWETEPLLEKIDDILEPRHQHFINNKNFEIIRGALSTGTYFMRRLTRSKKAGININLLVDALQQSKLGTRKTGYYWICNAVIEPRVYTGISHGSAMIISFLSALFENKFRQQDCVELIQYATKFLLNSRIDSDKFISSFPIWLGNTEPVRDLCLAYGDLGPAHAIIKAGTILKNKDFIKHATAIALTAAKRVSFAEAALADASVWYGVAGTFLLYNSIYRQTGTEEFSKIAEHWLLQIPSMATHNNEYLGFSSYFFHEAPSAQLGFNFGLTGIGLTLIQALSQDRYLLDNFIWLS